jgi:hypothetical protein
MPVTLKEGAVILLDTIIGEKRHPDYKHVVDLANDFTTYATGHNIGAKLKQFNMRETEEAFKQRVALSQMNTPDIVNSVFKPLQKVPRTPANILVAWDGAKDMKQSNEKKKELFEAGSKFWGEKSYEKYISKRLPELDTTDPNSFIVIEFKEDVDPLDPSKKGQANPYPFEVNSAEAINYKYKNNILQWLIVLNHYMMPDDKGNPNKGEIYYTYIDNETIRATEIHPTVVSNYTDLGVKVYKTITRGTNSIRPKTQIIFQIGEDAEKGRFFIIEVFEHKIGRVPAKRVGALTDTVTRDRTAVPIINPARSYFEKSIKTMSEFDLTNCLHVFPRLIQYSDACDGERTGENVIGCAGGLTPGGSKCKVCGGTGFKTHTSAQDAIHVRMPKDLNDLKSLENVLVYKSPPIDLLKFQQEFAFDKLREASIAAVYGGNQRTKLVKTATETEIDLDGYYDTLKPFADNFSDFFVWGYTCIAALRDMENGLVIKHHFPSDFEFQSLGSLLEELKIASENGAASHVKKAINTKIINKIYIDQPKEVLKIETKDKYYPFPGKSTEEINFIIANGKTTRYYETLYSHFDVIFADLEFQTESRSLNFYEMEEKLQRNLLSLKVKEILGEIDNQETADSANAFGTTGTEGTPSDIEAEAKANLKGSVGGVQGILDIQASVAAGTTERSAALAVLDKIYGFSGEDAEAILGEPKPPKTTELKIA